ncbi:asialoglycoprotein receptor 1-like [Parambassis ranga]|uniref:Asialoglycoprotein receptor 1-like n=1 Tax=Parambassis ranga TaxID=210632 RepID=A0A6P7IMY2_9TELE|nr:asialoglycoprotein receptor 1-like [Parambassis ranga]
MTELKEQVTSISSPFLYRVCQQYICCKLIPQQNKGRQSRVHLYNYSSNSMAEDVLYAQPDFTKKVKIQTGEKEDIKDADCEDTTDDTRIYDNYLAENTSPKALENMTEDQPKAPSDTENPGKRDYRGAVAVFLGLLLCFCLLAAVTALTVLSTKLRSERDKLVTQNSEIKSLTDNLTQKNSWLEKENTNLTKELGEIQKLMAETCCPDKWIKFGNSCLLISTILKTWTESRTFCQSHDADLVIISSRSEQEFISSFGKSVWIGLSDEESEGVWIWINGTEANKTYWKPQQPDNELANDRQINYVHIDGTEPGINNWNDFGSTETLGFVCEKILK